MSEKYECPHCHCVVKYFDDWWRCTHCESTFHGYEDKYPMAMRALDKFDKNWKKEEATE